MFWWLFGWWWPRADVFWTIRAIEELCAALPHLPAAAQDHYQDRLDAQLRAIFPRRARIVVTRLHRGFRFHPDRFVLQVEVEQSRAGHWTIVPHVVKIAFDDALGQLECEGTNYEACWPTGIPPGQVLMRLRPVRDSFGRIYALVYQEANNAIGSPDVVTLERAVLDCVRYNNPCLVDVRHAIRTLLAGLDGVHAQSQDEPADNSVASTFPAMPSLHRSLLLWENHDPHLLDGNVHRGRARLIADSINSAAPYIDPVVYLAYVRDQLARGITINTNSSPSHPFIPTTRIGWAHGDLHGRNVLVGIDCHGQLTTPAVFDYGRLEPGQPVVLDFVKLETELKIRALPGIFAEIHPQSRNPFLREFEHVLNLWTRHCILHNAWPRIERVPPYWPPEHRAEGSGLPSRTPREPLRPHRLRRLLAILLQIRERACQVLTRNALQPGTWFRQYLFWLAWYGVRTVRYTNLDEPELLSAYLSAGVAAAELQ